MAASGLGWDDVDIANRAGLPVSAGAVEPAVFGQNGFYSEFARAVEAYYARLYGTGSLAVKLSYNGTRHEPHVAQAVFGQMLAEANVTVRMSRYLVASDTSNGTVHSVTFEAGQSRRQETISAATFVDATYEGDLLALSGAPFRQGREGRREWGELNAGVVFQDNAKGCFLRGSTGSASPRLPAMTFRLCFTTNATNRVALAAPPAAYNRSRYLGYVDDRAAGRMAQVWEAWSGPRALPPTGEKFDINCNPRPLGFVWAGADKELYVDAVNAGAGAGATAWRGRAGSSAAGWADRALRQASLRDITLGLLWFLQHDAAVDPSARAANLRYGLCADEFVYTPAERAAGGAFANITLAHDHFPWQLYVREARRLLGLTTFTEADMVPQPEHPAGRPPLRAPSVAVGTYAIDAFPASERRPAAGQASGSTPLEGYISMERELSAPSTLPADAMLTSALDNLVVPTALSATHVAFSAVRLEPTWMMLGAAAGALAAQAWRGGVGVHDVPLLQLQSAVLLDAGQPLVFYTDIAGTGADLVGVTSSSSAGAGTASYYRAMQVLGPHGVADDEGFRARPSSPLERGRAARWLAGAMRARASTVGNASAAAAKWAQLGSERGGFHFQYGDRGRAGGTGCINSSWADYGPGDAFFEDAYALARMFIVTPPPSTCTHFRPLDAVDSDEWLAWLSRGLPLPRHHRENQQRQRARTRNADTGNDQIRLPALDLDRGAASVALLQAAMPATTAGA
jgi:hypothetical protein